MYPDRDHQRGRGDVPIAADLRLTAGDHVVHFYVDEDEHVRLVGGRLAASLREGDAVLIVARRARTDALVRHVAAAGVDVDAARAGGHLLTVDAEAALAEIMVDGEPHPERFDRVIGRLLQRAGDGERHVYGEMVDVLWEAGDVPGAIALEDLWNEMSLRIPFALICAYHRSSTPSADEADGFTHVCRRHTMVLGGAPLPSGCDRYRRFADSPVSSRAARRFVSRTLRNWQLDHLESDAVLVVAELATNAMLHGDSDFTVGLVGGPDALRIVVGDTSDRLPVAGDVRPDAIGGHGLRVVAALSTRWGHDVVPGGKLVWAELPTDPPARPTVPD